MSDDSDQAATEYSDLGGTLEIKSYQLDSGCLGNVQSSVNLFRGDVTLPLTLVSLPGRNGLDVTVNATYSSHVQQEAAASNADGPTGILGLGWALGVDAIVAEVSPSAAPGSTTYYVYAQGAANRLIPAGTEQRNGDTALRFLTVGHEFWRILFFVDADRWEITREDGITSIYGDPTRPGYTVQWGIRHDAWVGSTARPGGERYAVAWNLAEIRHPFGDAVTFQYLEDPVLIGSTSFTRASYLARIVDAAGRVVAFNYAAKQPAEYVAPHVDSHGQNIAYQDRYETQYLDSLVVSTDSGVVLFTVSCAYTLINFVDAARPEFVKRCLTGVTRRAADGTSRPGLTFSYVTGHDAPNRGALQTIVYPEGGSATYTYTQQSLGSPTGVGARIVADSPGGVPRVWFGSDYTVVTWYDDEAGQLVVSPYCLAGAWFSGSDISPTMAHIAKDSLQVAAAADFFAVSYTDTSAQVHVQVFRKDLRRPGQWTRFIAEVTQGSVDHPSPLVAGDQFLAWYPHGSGTVQQLTWMPLEQAWQPASRHVGGPDVALGAGPNFYTTFAYDANDVATLTLFAHDMRLQWQSTPLPASISKIYRYDGAPIASWRTGAAFAVATYVVAIDSSTITYQVVVYSWDPSFSTPRVHTPSPYTSPLAALLPAGVSAVAGALIGSAQYLLRFDGVEWIADRFDVTVTGENAAAFDYGSDLAVLTQKDGTVSARRFDPSTLAWQAVALDPGSSGATAVPPQISGDFLTVGRHVYRRTPASAWSSLAQPLPNDTNPASVRNAAPRYVAYERGTGGDAHAEVSLIANGELSAPVSLDGERIYVEGTPVPGTALASAGMLVTYPSTGSFDKARRLTLYAVLAPQQTAAGTLHEAIDYPVVALTTDDGYSARSTAYRYDATAAIFDPAGRITQYPIVRVYTGLAPGEAAASTANPSPANGWTEYQFLNGVDPGRADVYWPGDTTAHYGALAGSLVSTRTYDAAGRPIAAAFNVPKVWTSSAGQSLPIGFTRIAQTVTVSELMPLLSIASSPAIRRFLDGADDMPADLAAAFAAAGAPSTAAIASSPERADQRWVLFDRDNRRLYFAVLDDTRINVLTGVSEAVSTDYDDTTGLPVRRTTVNRRIDNTLETAVQQMTYASQVYPDIRAAHLLAPTVQTTLTVDGTVQTSAVTTFRDWSGSGHWAAEVSYRTTTGGAAYDFSRGGDQPGWLAVNRILARRPCGLVAESVGASGMHRSTLYDRSDRYPIASFPNACLSAGEAAYYGAEQYELNPGWAVQPGQQAPPVREHDSHVGTRSLELRPSASGALQLTLPAVKPTNGNTRYLFSCWYKTTPRFDAEPGEVKWTIAASGAAPVSGDITLANTHGQWTYAAGWFDLSSSIGASAMAVTISATNRKASEVVLVDELRFSPVGAGYSARCYDPATWAVTAALAENGHTVRDIHDSFHEVVASVGPEGSPSAVRGAYWSRAGNGDRFAAADPNATFGVVAAGRGAAPRFVEDGDDWQQFWQACTPSLANWAFTGGALHHLTSTTDRLQVAGSDQFKGACLQLALRPEESPTQPIGLSVAGLVTVKWVPAAGGGHWELFDEAAQQPIRTSQGSTLDRLPQRWTLVVVGDAVLFYVDGRQLFAWQSPRPLTGPLSFFTANRVALADVVVFEQPQLLTSYRSGTGVTLQSQSLETVAPMAGHAGVNHVVATGVIYDPAGRPAVKTKPVRYSQALCEYRPDLVTSIDWNTGVMGGDVASYYGASGGGFSDDEGYPYLRTVYEPSPLGRVVARGNPGKALAVVNSGKPGDGHVQQFAYGGNAAGDMFGDLKLYTGEFFVKTATDANGVVTGILRDRRGREVLRRTLDPLQPHAFASTGVDYDSMGRVIARKPPLYYESGDSSLVTRFAYDGLGRLQSASVPDQQHPTRAIYSSDGRCRFLQSGVGAEAQPPFVQYQKYDGLGRPIEVGCVAAAWDPAALQVKADDPAWPSDATWWKRFVYDGDGKSARSVGYATQVHAANAPGGAADVVEQFGYDVRGQMSTRSTMVAADGGAEYLTAYEYDNAGQMTAVTYPAVADSAAHRVVYRYNSLGQVVEIGSDQADGRVYASYEYNAAGSPVRECWTAGAATINTRTWSFNSPGWPTHVADDFLSETLAYLPESGGRGYYDGQIASARYQFTWPAAPAGYDYDLAYDHTGNLTAAVNAAMPEASVDALTYDGNGNVLSLRSGAQTRRYGYAPHGNRLINADGGSGADCTYDANGSVVAMSAGMRSQGLANVVYHPYSGMATAMTTESSDHQPSASLRFTYGADEQRVVKTVTAGGVTTSKVYVCGHAGLPLLEKSIDAQGQATATSYIYGRDGLLAFRRRGRLYFVGKDHARSTRVVVDASGTSPSVVASYDYTPFGAPVRITGDANAITYLFNGLERDVETGLHKTHVRFYDPSLQRFLGADPLGQFATPYGYASNNPMLYSDPSGLWSIKGWFEDVASLAVSALEIAAGVAMEALSGGSLSALSGGLIGAGTSGVIYTATHWDSFDWGDFGIQQAIGGAAGLALGGVAQGYRAGATAAADVADDGTAAEMADLAGARSGAARAGRDLTGQVARCSRQGQCEFAASGDEAAACFVPGTPIAAEHGIVAIETIQAGDRVWAFDEQTGSSSLQRVLRTFTSEASTAIDLTTREGTMAVTGGHPFWVVGEGWVHARDLRPQHRLVSRDGGDVVVLAIRSREAPLLVHNFEVDQAHTYYAGSGGILVHNMCNGEDDGFGLGLDRAPAPRGLPRAPELDERRYFHWTDENAPTRTVDPATLGEDAVARYDTITSATGLPRDMAAIIFHLAPPTPTPTVWAGLVPAGSRCPWRPILGAFAFGAFVGGMFAFKAALKPGENP